MRARQNHDKTNSYDDKSSLDLCPICGRPLIKGTSVEYHHLRPKSKGGRETLPLHAVCHRMLHKVFSKNALAACGESLQTLRDHPDIAKFVRWMAKKPPELTDRPRTKGRKPYHQAAR